MICQIFWVISKKSHDMTVSMTSPIFVGDFPRCQRAQRAWHAGLQGPGGGLGGEGPAAWRPADAWGEPGGGQGGRGRAAGTVRGLGTGGSSHRIP